MKKQLWMLCVGILLSNNLQSQTVNSAIIDESKNSAFFTTARNGFGNNYSTGTVFNLFLVSMQTIQQLSKYLFFNLSDLVP